MGQQKAIIQLFCEGKTNPEIVKILKASKSRVRDAVNQYKKLRTSDNRPKSGKPQTACTPTKIKAIREIRFNKNCMFSVFFGSLCKRWKDFPWLPCQPNILHLG